MKRNENFEYSFGKNDSKQLFSNKEIFAKYHLSSQILPLFYYNNASKPLHLLSYE